MSRQDKKVQVTEASAPSSPTEVTVGLGLASSGFLVTKPFQLWLLEPA